MVLDCVEKAVRATVNRGQWDVVDVKVVWVYLLDCSGMCVLKRSGQVGNRCVGEVSLSLRGGSYGREPRMGSLASEVFR